MQQQRYQIQTLWNTERREYEYRVVDTRTGLTHFATAVIERAEQFKDQLNGAKS